MSVSTPLTSRGVAQPTESPTPAESPVGAVKEKRSRTRVPPSVRSKERRQKENRPQRGAAIEPKHTPPKLSATSKEAPPIPDYVALLMDHVDGAISDRNWEKLGDLLEALSHPETGLDLRQLAKNPAVNRVLDRAAIRVLTAATPVTDEQLSLALDLLNIGCDWNAKDERGNSVLTLLRRHADDDVLEFISKDFPHFRHLFTDPEGHPIKPGH